MNKKLLWITETAVMTALLVTLQAVTAPMGQFVTGSCVNAVLAVTALVVGLSGGLTVAVISPVMAYFLGIADQILVVPAIMLGNTVFVMALHWIRGKEWYWRIFAWLGAAVAKFAAMYAVVGWLICDVFAQSLLAAGKLKPPMIAALTAKFSWPQLVTALIGGGLAMAIVPVLRKALKR